MRAFIPRQRFLEPPVSIPLGMQPVRSNGDHSGAFATALTHSPRDYIINYTVKGVTCLLIMKYWCARVPPANQTACFQGLPKLQNLHCLFIMVFSRDNTQYSSVVCLWDSPSRECFSDASDYHANIITPNKPSSKQILIKLIIN